VLVEILLGLGAAFLIIVVFHSVLLGGILALTAILAYDKFLIPWLATRIKLEGTVVHPGEQLLVLAQDADRWLWGHRMLGFQVGHNILKVQREIMASESFQDAYKEMTKADLPVKPKEVDESGKALEVKPEEVKKFDEALEHLPVDFDVVAGSAVESMTPMAFAVFFIPRERTVVEKEISETDSAGQTIKVITREIVELPVEAHYGQNYDIWSLRQELVLKAESVDDLGNIPFQTLAGTDKEGNIVIEIKEYPAYMLNMKRLATEGEKDAYLRVGMALSENFPTIQHALRGIQYLSRERKINVELKKQAESDRELSMRNAITIEKLKTDVIGTPLAGIWDRVNSRIKEQMPVNPVEEAKRNWALLLLIAVVASVLGYYLYPSIIKVASDIIAWFQEWVAAGGQL